MFEQLRLRSTNLAVQSLPLLDFILGLSDDAVNLSAFLAT